MVTASFFSSELLFFKCIYILAFLGVFYVIYETIFVEEEQHSGITLYLLVLFGFYFLRRANAVIRHRKAEKTQKDK